MRQRDRRQFEAHAHQWLEAYRNLETILERPLQTKLTGFDVDPKKPGNEAARALREHIGLSDDQPIVSVVELLEQFGIRVIEIRSDARIDALAGHLGDERVIVLNAALSNDRVRLNA